MKTALITGASRGIGAAAARALAEDGWRVVINYLNSEEKAHALAEELGGQAVRADVSDPRQVDELFCAAGRVDLLVCNAGIAVRGLLTDTPDQVWRRLFAVNVDGAFYCCRRALPAMIREKRGNIILVSSVCGVYGASCEVPYSATKAALIGLGKALAREVGPSGIRVNCVAPGYIDTDMTAGFSPETRELLRCETPLGRVGLPEDPARLIAFLADERSAFITGQVIGTDGGLIL